jgi:hypothetical protein
MTVFGESLRAQLVLDVDEGGSRLLVRDWRKATGFDLKRG